MKNIIKILGIVTIILLITASITISFAADIGYEYSVNDLDKVRILGRGYATADDSHTFNWVGSGIEFVFTGSKAEVYVDKLTIYDYSELNNVFFNVIIDDGAPERITLNTGWNTIYEGISATHKITLLRSSEAQRGVLSIKSVRTDTDTVSASSPKDRFIQFIGDSYTVGYGNRTDISMSDSYCAQNTDNYYAYSEYAARALDADFNITAYSGRGLCMGYGNGVINSENFIKHNLNEQYYYSEPYITNGVTDTFNSKTKWALSQDKPQVIVVFLGTNDYNSAKDIYGKDNLDTKMSNGYSPREYFKNEYVKFITDIKEKFPYTTIICCSKPNGCFKEEVDIAVEELGGESNRIYRQIFNTFDGSTGIGAHPGMHTHKLMSEELVATINSIDGVWNIPTEIEQSNKLVRINADYNTGTVHIFGTTDSAKDFVSTMIYKPENEQVPSAENLAFIDQVQADSNGNYEFNFATDILKGNYTMRINSKSINNVSVNDFEFSSYIPNIKVTVDSKEVDSLEMAAGKTLNVNVSGFFKNKAEYNGGLFIAQYKDGTLVEVASKDVPAVTTAYGEAFNTSTHISSDIDLVKVFYIDYSKLTPLFGVYSLK